MPLMDEGNRYERIVFITAILDNYGAARTLHAIIQTVDQARIPCEIWFPRDTKIEPNFNHSFSERIIFRQMDIPVLRRKKVYEFHFLLTLIRYIFNGFKIRKVTHSAQYSNTRFHVFTSASALGVFLVPKSNRLISVHEFSKNGFERLILKYLFLISGPMRVFASHAVMSHYGIKGHVIHSGANIEVFRNVKKSLFRPGDTLNILCVGRITQTKGQMIVLQALSRLMKDHQNFKAIFVGSPFGETVDYLDSCLDFIKSNRLDGNVKFVGERSDIYEFYEDADLVVVPSIQPEAFGKVLVEGMASSNVVIATKIGGPLEIIDHEINGLLVSPNSVKQLTNVISKVIIGDYDLESIVRNAKIRANSFNENDSGRKYYNLLINGYL